MSRELRLLIIWSQVEQNRPVLKQDAVQLRWCTVLGQDVIQDDSSYVAEPQGSLRAEDRPTSVMHQLRMRVYVMIWDELAQPSLT